MPPPRKRPRLHFVPSTTPEPDAELQAKRLRNDNLLKTRWEHIFQRYEKDFSNIGDEINVVTGEIEVDNGHLRDMQDELDTGMDQPQSSAFDGRRMLRAMTLAPSDDDHNPDADTVLQSIEVMADNADLSDYSSDDDLFESTSTSLSLQPDELSDDFYHADDAPSGAVETWDDSRARPAARSPSLDSLFDVHVDSSAMKRESSSALSDIVTPYGDQVPRAAANKQSIRDEVRKILQEERARQLEQAEENVESAWRVPIHPLPSLNLLPRIASTEPSPATNHDDDRLSHVSGLDASAAPSIWTNPVRTRRSRQEVVAERNLRQIRAESEDPLQEGFDSEPEPTSATISKRSAVRLPPVTQSESRRCAAVSPPSSETSKSRSKDSSAPHQVRPSSSDITGSEEGGSRIYARFAMQGLDGRQNLMSELDPISHQITTHSRSANEMEQQVATGFDIDFDSDDEYLPQTSKRKSKLTRKQPPPRTTNTRRSDASVAMAEVDVPTSQGVVVETENSNRTEFIANPPETSPGYQFIMDATQYFGGPDVDNAENQKKRKRTQHHNQRPAPRFSLKETEVDKRSHPWQMPVTRSGRPLSALSMSLRKKEGVKFMEQASSAQDAAEASETEHETLNPQDQVVRELERRKILKPMTEGICYYCKANHRDKYGVGSHWDRVLTNFAVNALDFDDPHDIDFIHSMRKNVERRTRPPMTFLADFRLSVELHEGQGMSFEQIMDAKVLKSCKPAEQVEKEYHMWRQTTNPEQPQRKWPTEATQKLNKIIDDNSGPNPTYKRLTLIKTHRLLGKNHGFSFVDVGNKLAELFLSRHETSGDSFTDQIQMYSRQVSNSEAPDSETTHDQAQSSTSMSLPAFPFQNELEDNARGKSKSADALNRGSSMSEPQEKILELEEFRRQQYQANPNVYPLAKSSTSGNRQSYQVRGWIDMAPRRLVT